jgi:hypothetical protein
MRVGLVCAIALSVLGAGPDSHGDAAVICQRKHRLRLRVDRCRPKETQLLDTASAAAVGTRLATLEAWAGFSCAGDPSRRLAVSAILDPTHAATSGCRRFDGDAAACAAAYQTSNLLGASSCEYDGGTCFPCDLASQDEGVCRNACNPADCHDATRTRRAKCGRLLTQADCEQGFGNVPSIGGSLIVAPCWWDTGSGTCKLCDAKSEAAGACANTCGVRPSCREPTRTLFGACEDFDGDQVSCEKAFTDGGHVDLQVIGPTGLLSCYYDAGTCRPCWIIDQLTGRCRNAC